jgi:hypothetical protein
MEVSFSNDVKGTLDKHGKDLRIQGKFMPDGNLLGSYLEGKFGNAYNFDQRDKVDVCF